MAIAGRNLFAEVTGLASLMAWGKFMSIDETVRQIVADHLGVKQEQVVAAARFDTDLRADFLDRVDLVLALEDAFGLEITDEEAGKMRTVNDAVQHISTCLGKKAASLGAAGDSADGRLAAAG